MEWSWVVGITGLVALLPYLSCALLPNVPCWTVGVVNACLLVLAWSGYLLELDPILFWLQPIVCCGATLLVAVFFVLLRMPSGDAR